MIHFDDVLFFLSSIIAFMFFSFFEMFDGEVAIFKYHLEMSDQDFNDSFGKVYKRSFDLYIE